MVRLALARPLRALVRASLTMTDVEGISGNETSDDCADSGLRGELVHRDNAGLSAAPFTRSLGPTRKLGKTLARLRDLGMTSVVVV